MLDSSVSKIRGQGPDRAAGSAAMASDARLAVQSATLQAGGAGVIVQLRMTCSEPDWYGDYVSVSLSQRLPNGSIASSTEGAQVSCDGQQHTTRIGLPAATDDVSGKPFRLGTALVQATLKDATLATQVRIGPQDGGTGSNEGYFEFYLQPTGRLLAGGAGMQVEVKVRCQGPDYAVLTVAQLDGTSVITGDGAAARRLFHF